MNCTLVLHCEGPVASLEHNYITPTIGCQSILDSRQASLNVATCGAIVCQQKNPIVGIAEHLDEIFSESNRIVICKGSSSDIPIFLNPNY